MNFLRHRTNQTVTSGVLPLLFILSFLAPVRSFGQPLILSGHGAEISASHLAFSGDAARLISVAADSTVRVWDTRTGEEIAELRSSMGNIAYAFLNRDGSYAITLRAGEYLLWDVEEGSIVRTFTHKSLENSGINQAFRVEAQDKVIATINRSLFYFSFSPESDGYPKDVHRLDEPGTAFGSLIMADDGNSGVFAHWGMYENPWESDDFPPFEGIHFMFFHYPFSVYRTDTVLYEVNISVAAMHPGSSEEFSIRDGLKHMFIPYSATPNRINHGYSGIPNTTLRSRIRQLRYTPDGKELHGYNTDSVFRWDVASGEYLGGFRASSSTIAFSDDNQTVATGYPDGRIAISSSISSASRVDTTAASFNVLVDKVFSNGENHDVGLQLFLQRTSDILVSLIDARGNIAGRLYQDNLEAGPRHITFSTGDIASGIYFLLVESEHHRSSVPLIVR